jgi:hypothetical protein
MASSGSPPASPPPPSQVVSARTASLLVALAVKSGIPRHRIDLSIEDGRTPTLPWKRYVALLAQLEALAGGEEGFIRVCARFGEVLPNLRGLLSLPCLTDAAAVLAHTYVAMAYPMMSLRVELVSPGQIHIGYRLPASYEGSLALAHSLVGTFRGLPRLGGLPDAEVIIERLGPRAFDALVVLPEERSSPFPSLAEDTASTNAEASLDPAVAALRSERALIERVVSTLVFAGPSTDDISPFAALAAEVMLREAGGTFVRISQLGSQLALAGSLPPFDPPPPLNGHARLPLDDHEGGSPGGLLELDGPRAPLLRAIAPWLGRELRRRAQA